MKHFSFFSMTIGVVLILAGCGAQPIPVTTQDNGEVKDTTSLIEEWHQLTETDYEHVNMDRAVIIANELALQDENGLDPIFKVLEDPEEKPMAKMLAVVSLSPHIDDSHVERLMPLTEPEYDSATRGCAAHLLGICVDSNAFFRVMELTEDEDAHVSKVATMVMLRKGDPNVIPKILEIWDDPNASPKDREEIVLGMPAPAALKNIRIFKEALCDETLNLTARSHAAKVLGDLASTAEIPAIKACLEKITDTALVENVQSAIASIEEREKEGGGAPQIQMPDGVGLVFKPKDADDAATPSEAATETAPEN